MYAFFQVFLTNQEVQQQEPANVEVIDEFGQNFQQNNEQDSLKESEHEWNQQFRLTLEGSIDKQHGSDRQKPSEKDQTNVDTDQH